METLPTDLDYYLLAELPLVELYHLCRTNRNYRAVCQNENMWRIRYQKEYPNQKLETGTYRDFYLLPINIYYNKRYLETIRIFRNQLLHLPIDMIIRYLRTNKLIKPTPYYLIILNDNNKNIHSFITIENKYDPNGNRIISTNTNYIIIDPNMIITQINILTTATILGFFETVKGNFISYYNILENTRNIHGYSLYYDTLNNILDRKTYEDYLDIIENEYRIDLDEFINNTNFQYTYIPPGVIISKSGHVIATTDHMYKGYPINSLEIWHFMKRYIVILNKLKSFI